MPKPQIDNTAVKRPLHPEDYPDLIGPPAPKRHDTGYITQDYSNPFQRAAQKWSSAYLNSSFANSPFMDVMRWIPGLNYVEKILTAQPVSEEESMGFMTPVKIGKPSITSEPFQILATDINTGRKDAVNFLKSDAVKSSEAHNVALAERAGFGRIPSNTNRAAAASTPMIKQDLSKTKNADRAKDLFWVGKDNDGYYIKTGNFNSEKGFMSTSGGLGFPEKDIMILDPFTCTSPLSATAFHETLHRGAYGTTPRMQDFFRKVQLNTATDSEILSNCNKYAAGEDFYSWKVDKLVNRNSKLPLDYLEYMIDPTEFGVHAAEMGYTAGLKPGQPYPGKIKALEILTNISNKDYRFNAYDWQNKPKRVWDALTGKYFALPIIGLGGGTAAVSATQKQEEQQTQ